MLLVKKESAGPLETDMKIFMLKKFRKCFRQVKDRTFGFGLRNSEGQPLMLFWILPVICTLTAKEWALPNFWVENAKSQRGEITVSVDEGLRLVPVASGRTMFKEASEDGESDTFRFRKIMCGVSPSSAITRQ